MSKLNDQLKHYTKRTQQNFLTDLFIKITLASIFYASLVKAEIKFLKENRKDEKICSRL